MSLVISICFIRSYTINSKIQTRMIVAIEDVIVAIAFVATAPILIKNAFAHSGHHYHHH
ncbi:MAG: hypothetical protein WBP64_09955 [Nitrososphaeraceae archaeon]